LATTLTLRVGKAANCGEVKRQLSATLILISAAALRRPIDPVISDWFYPAAATASAVILLRQAFCDTGLLNSCVAVIGAPSSEILISRSILQNSLINPVLSRR